MTGPHQSFRQHSSYRGLAARASAYSCPGGGAVSVTVCAFTIQLGPRCLVHPGQLITVVETRDPLSSLLDHRVCWLGFRPNYGNVAVMRCGGRWMRPPRYPRAFSFLVLIKRLAQASYLPVAAFTLAHTTWISPGSRPGSRRYRHRRGLENRRDRARPRGKKISLSTRRYSVELVLSSWIFR